MTDSLFRCRFWGVLDLFVHTLRLDRFGWAHRVCDAYDDAFQRHKYGR